MGSEDFRKCSAVLTIIQKKSLKLMIEV